MQVDDLINIATRIAQKNNKTDIDLIVLTMAIIEYDYEYSGNDDEEPSMTSILTGLGIDAYDYYNKLKNHLIMSKKHGKTKQVNIYLDGVNEIR